MADIQPLSREKLRLLRSLLSRRLRERRGLCLVEGEKNLAEASRTGFLKFLVAREGSRRTEAGGRLGERVPFFMAPEAVWEEISEVIASPGLLGVAKVPAPPPLARLGEGKGRGPGKARLRALFLDAVQDPGNVGALIRSAWALSFDAAFLGRGSADPFGPKAVRASAGGVFHLPCYTEAGKGTVADLAAAGFSLYLADREGEPVRRASFAPRSLLVLGSEGGGISPWLREQAAAAVSIPMRPGVDSLNVVVAGSIIMAAMME